MRTIALTICLLFASLIKAQEVYIVACGNANTIYSNERVEISKLQFTCARTLLVQDNSIVRLYDVEGYGEIKRGGKAGAPINAEGIDRFEGDAEPLVILIGCASNFETLTIDPLIEVTTDFFDCNNKP